jgi:hypothetical protein
MVRSQQVATLRRRGSKNLRNQVALRACNFGIVFTCALAYF